MVLRRHPTLSSSEPPPKRSPVRWRTQLYKVSVSIHHRPLSVDKSRVSTLPLPYLQATNKLFRGSPRTDHCPLFIDQSRVSALTLLYLQAINNIETHINKMNTGQRSLKLVILRSTSTFNQKRGIPKLSGKAMALKPKAKAHS